MDNTLEIVEVVNTLRIEEENVNLLQVQEAQTNILSEIEQGVSGASAYEIAVSNGFVGTEEEWLLSLKGEPGSGGGSDANFVHNQNSASTIWTINHNLGKFPAIKTVDSSGQRVWGQEQDINENTVVVTFSAPFSGKAYAN